MSTSYNMANIRALLSEGFSDEEVRFLCYDTPAFRPVYDRLSPNTGKAQVIQLLIEHADRNLQLETLLILAKEHNPARYEKYQPYYDITPSPTTSSDVHGKSQRINNLPAQSTVLIGREQEIATTCSLLRQSDVRLLTLTGPPGTGKTRLGLQVATKALDDFASGVCFVALAPLNDPSLVAVAVAQALGIMEIGSRSLVASLVDYLRDKQILLLLDNFEQVVDAAPLLGELLVAAPRLKILVTSRVVLRLYGEREFFVPPLSLPVSKHLPPPEQLIQYEAVRLFIERAQSVKGDFVVTKANAPAVVEICRRLDGLPLAIELAAARIKVLTPSALLERLTNRFTLLKGGARNLPTRQQTLREAINWSYELLDTIEQRLFTRLGVFVGGCTLVAAETVCNMAGDLEIDMVDGLASLLDKSLLRQEEGVDGEPRFVMLETIREYALERLAASGESTIIRQNHLYVFLSLVKEAKSGLEEAEQATGLKRLKQEHNNLQAALVWAVEQGEVEIGLQLAGALFDYQLGDTTRLMAQLLRSGYSLLQTINIVARESPEPTASAFQRVVEDVKQGQTVAEALNGLIQRVPSNHLRLVIAAVNKQKNEGGNLAHMLEPISQTLHEWLEGDVPARASEDND